jgi:HPt (histidine-containing phosphotransfer) domain-containing protein
VSALGTNGLNLADLKDARFDLDALWRRVGHDRELLRELIGLLECESPAMLAQIASAIGKDDAEQVRKLSHKIKGSLLQFSGQAAAACAAKLEELGRNSSVAGADQLLHELEREIGLLLESLNKITRTKSEDRELEQD